MLTRPAVPSTRRAARVALLAFVLVLVPASCDRPAPAEAARRIEPQPLASSDRLALPASGAPGAEGPALALEAAWNVGDAVGVAAQYTEDVEIINPVGVLLAGHDAALAAHTFLFAGPFKGSHRTTEVRRVTYLTGTIAVVELTARLTDFLGLPPGLRATAPGLVVQRERQVVVKRGGEWKILMVQITPLPPAP